VFMKDLEDPITIKLYMSHIKLQFIWWTVTWNAAP
jgi:hypothetical protein